MAKPSAFTVVMGKYTSVCLGSAQRDSPRVRVADVSFEDQMLSRLFWEVVNPRVISGECWCDVGHIAHELCDKLCPTDGTFTLEADGEKHSYFVTCLADMTGGAA